MGLPIYLKKEKPKLKLRVYAEADFLGVKSVQNYVIRYKGLFLTAPMKEIQQVNERRVYLFQTSYGDYYAQSLGGTIIIKLHTISWTEKQNLSPVCKYQLYKKGLKTQSKN